MGFMGNRRGAFQLSLSFIIGIVFAIVVLSLAVMWIQGLFVGFTDMSETLKQEANLKLEKTFQESNKDFDIWPTKIEITPNTRLSVTAGLKNDAMDSERHKFVVSAEILSSPEGTSKSEIEGWLDWAKPSKVVNPNENTKIPIIITVPSSGMQSGTYIFRITGCSDCNSPRCGPGNTGNGKIEYTACDSNSEYVWGNSAEDFVLIIK